MTKESKENKGTVKPASMMQVPVDNSMLNARNIAWPTDPNGAMLSLREGGVASVRRIQGDEANFELFMTTLKMLAAHAKAAYEYRKQEREVARENALNAARRRRERAVREKLAEAEATIAAGKLAAEEAKRAQAVLDTLRGKVSTEGTTKEGE